MSESTNWIFFDIGNTLFDETDAIYNRIGRVLSAAQDLGYIKLQEEEIYRQIEVAASKFAEWPLLTALTSVGIQTEHARQIASSCKYKHDYEKLFPETMGILDNLSARYRMGYIANQAPGLDERMQRMGISRYFQVGIGSGDSALSKPSEEIYRAALEKAACIASSAMMIGDRVDNDIAPAKRLGMKTIRIRRGYSQWQEPRNIAETADHTLSTLDQLLQIL